MSPFEPLTRVKYTLIAGSQETIMPRKPNVITGVFEKNPGSGIWYVRYRPTGGALVRKRIGSRADAIEYLNKVRLIKATGEGVIAKSAREITRTKQELDNGVTVGKLCDEYLEHIQSPDNPERPADQFSPIQRIHAIKEAFGDRSAVSVMPFEVRSWLMGLGKKPATLNRYRSVFSSVYRHAKEEGKLTVNPVRDLKQFKVELPDPRWMSPEEEDRLRDVLARWIQECPPEHRLKRLYLRCHPIELTVAIRTGLRKANQYALRWDEHIDLKNRKISLPPSMTKTGKALRIPIVPAVYEALKEMQKIQKEIEQIQSEISDQERQRMVANGRVFNTSENREWWAAALKEAKIKDFRWHDLRHTFATRLMESSKNMAIVKAACGHGSIATTTRYAHVNDDAIRKAMEQS
jgi:integrase